MNTTPHTTDTAKQQAKSMEELVALCKRRGFIFQASEIYGGLNGFWDYGPLGTELKNNLRDAWWNDMVKCPPVGPDGEVVSMLGVDTAIIQHPRVWEASGHVAGFNDPMVDCRETKQRFRADQLVLVNLLRFGEDEEEKRKLIEEISKEYMVGEIWPVKKPVASIVASGAAEAKHILLHTPKSVQFARDVRATIKKVADWEDVEADGRSARLAVEFKDGSYGMFFLAHLSANALGEFIRDLGNSVPSPFTGNYGTLTEPRMFNLMFETYIGAVRNEEAKSYLRPETAQGIFLNYKNVLDTMRVKIPFGIAQIGKAFRNEVTPRNYIFRSREFEQMEIEFFCSPADKRKWYDFWCDVRKNWWKALGLTDANLQMRQHENDELAHYAKEGCGCFDVEYRFPFTFPGFGELEGVADRTDYDLRKHQEYSGAKLEYFDQEKNERYLPHVIEPSAGLSRGVLAVLCEAFTPTPERAGSKWVMNFHPRLAPIKAAIFPLVAKEGMPEVAQKLYEDLRGRYAVQFDVKQSIGKRYARMDEAGTPFCFTVDGETMTNQTVTVRDRDTAAQERIGIDQVKAFLAERIHV